MRKALIASLVALLVSMATCSVGFHMVSKYRAEAEESMARAQQWQELDATREGLLKRTADRCLNGVESYKQFARCWRQEIELEAIRVRETRRLLEKGEQ